MVIGQFACMAVLLAGSWTLPWWAWSLFLLGVAIFLWALLSLGKHNLAVLPAPRAGNRLSNQGIYRRVRHPMYLGVLLCGLALALGAPAWWRWAAWGGALAVLVMKVLHEERQLTLLHPDYPARMRGVAHLFPGVW